MDIYLLGKLIGKLTILSKRKVVCSKNSVPDNVKLNYFFFIYLQLHKLCQNLLFMNVTTRFLFIQVCAVMKYLKISRMIRV